MSVKGHKGTNPSSLSFETNSQFEISTPSVRASECAKSQNASSGQVVVKQTSRGVGVKLVD